MSRNDTFIINGKNITGIASFYIEVNRVFMQNETWKIAQSLDAFNDLLYGGFGSIGNSNTIEIIWLDIELSRKALGYEATKQYYLAKLEPGSAFNKELFTEKLYRLEHGKGQTYFDIVLEIIAAHGNISLSRK